MPKCLAFMADINYISASPTKKTIVNLFLRMRTYFNPTVQPSLVFIRNGNTVKSPFICKRTLMLMVNVAVHDFISILVESADYIAVIILNPIAIVVTIAVN